MRLGFHLSIKGGYKKVIERGYALSCECVQFFPGNPRGWKRKIPEKEDIEVFLENKKRIFPYIMHASYLTRPGSKKRELREKSIKSLEKEIEIAKSLGVDYYVIHFPSPREDIRLFIHALINVKNNVEILIENTAKSKFKDMEKLVEEGFKICLDTAHAYQAGYNWRRDVEKIIKEIEGSIGMGAIKLIHLNDSKTPSGSGIDRHWHIGEGMIGKEGFINLLPYFLNIPGIMETPRESEADDRRNMKRIKMFISLLR